MDRSRKIKRKSMFLLCTCGELLWTASLRSLYMLSVLLCLNFCLGWMGAAKSNANQCFHFASEENCFRQPPLDLSICYQFAAVLISAWGGWAPRVHARINVSTLRLRRRIAFQNLSQIALHALSSLLSQFPLGVDGRRKFKRNALCQLCPCGKLL